MTNFAATAPPKDPYRGFNFKLKWGGVPVAGFTKAGSLTHKSPGRTEYDAITLERGITHDATFESWVNTTASGKPATVSLANHRRDLTLEVLNEAGEVAHTYTVHASWVSEYQAIPDLDATPNAVAIQHIKLENQGLTRLT
jgi:phage tail-like protein